MRDINDETRKAVLGEVFLDELKIIREYLEDVSVIKQKVIRLEQDVDEIKADMRAVKALLKEHHQTLGNHEYRLTLLESAGHT